MMDLKKANDKLTKWLSDNIIIVYLAFIFFILVLPFIFTRYSLIGFGIKPNEIGDAINGLTAPIIGTFSVLLVYLAFKSQLDANEKLNQANVKLLKISEDQLRFTEFQMFKEKLEYIKNNHDTSFIFNLSNETNNINNEPIKTYNERENKAKIYLKRFDKKSIDVKRTLDIISLFNKQLNQSSLSQIDIDFLGLEIKRLKYIRENISKYNFNETFLSTFKIQNNNNILKRYLRTINHIEKMDL
jgi:hypothetical protein